MRRLATALGALALCGTAAGEPVTRDDFFEGYRLAVDGASPLYRVELPLAVYRRSTRADLGDLRVFNGAGEIVPHGIEPADTRIERPTTEIALPHFPLRIAGGAGTAGLSLRIRRGADGTITDIEVDEQGHETPSRAAYLVDMSGLDRPVGALRLAWPDSAVGFVRTLELSVSDDLVRWRALAERATIADLRHQGHALRQSRIGLPAIRAAFLLITARGESGAPAITGFTAELSRAAGAPPLEWAALEVRADQEQAGRYLFELPGALPARRLRVAPPQRNTLVDARVLSRPAPDVAWGQRASFLLHDLDYDGGAVRSAPVTIRAAGHPHWALAVDTRGGGLGTGLPAVEVGWIPRVLVFVARGTPPYLLAVGSARAEPVSVSATKLLDRATPAADGSLGLPSAMLGARVHLAGEAALEPAPRRVDWKRWMLWGALVAGVGLLGVMAFRLAREVRAG